MKHGRPDFPAQMRIRRAIGQKFREHFIGSDDGPWGEFWP
jgi:hypothetical protein